MSTNDWLQFLIYIAILGALTAPLGTYMAKVFAGEPFWMSRFLGPVERGLYRLCGIKADQEQNWRTYAYALLLFNFAGMLLLYAILRLQGHLPFNPQHMPGMNPDLAFNTAVSFATNTNWQAYSGESSLSYFSQMAGLTVQNFVSAATGIAVAVALFRGLARRSASTVGNFYVDLTRSIIYLLLPLSVIVALLLLWQGVPQNLAHYIHATTLQGAHQTIAQGPAASQVAIKQLGTNGGGFFGVNSAHPYANPTPLSDLIEMASILLIPAALVYTFGRMVGDRRQGWVLYAAMAILFVAGFLMIVHAEHAANPLYSQAVSQTGGNMEGKEVRFGVINSSLWAEATTAASNGSVNSMLDSFTAIGGMIPMFNIMLGEIIFGGVGAGLYGMILFVILTVFIAGLMVGRTPEYLGKKIEAKEVKLAVLALLTIPVGILGLGAFSAVLPVALTSVLNHGPHGLSEILYAYSSATGNNGSAFAGFNANTPYQNTLLGIAMLIGRYGMIIPMLAVAGSLAAKKHVPASSGTFPTHTPLFIGLLLGVILIVGGLTFFPALALGPIAEHFAVLAGHTF